MNSITFFIFFIPLLSFILLIINFYLATHKPNKDKDSQFECGFTSFVQMSRMAFTISFFIYGLLFLLFDLEILLVYPYVVSSYNNDIYGLIVMILFFILLTVGFVYEIGNKALQIDSRQTLSLFRSNSLKIINKQSMSFGFKRQLVIYRRTFLKMYYKCYNHVNTLIFKLPYKVIMVIITMLVVKFVTKGPLLSWLDTYHLGLLVYIYWFLLGILTIYLVSRAQNRKISCSDCVLLQIDRLNKGIIWALLIWLLSFFFSPLLIVYQCQGPWVFSEEGGAQLKRGYIHPSQTMKIQNVLNYTEGTSPNQPVGNEIVKNLQKAGYYQQGWTYHNHHLPEEARRFLVGHLKYNYPARYSSCFVNGQFRLSTPRITESLIRDLKNLK